MGEHIQDIPKSEYLEKLKIFFFSERLIRIRFFHFGHLDIFILTDITEIFQTSVFPKKVPPKLQGPSYRKKKTKQNKK